MPSKCLKSSWFSGHLSQLEASYNQAPKDTEHLHLKHLWLSIFTQLKHSTIHPKTKNNHMLNIKSGHWKCNDILIYTVYRAYHWRMLFSLPFCAPQKASRWGQQGSANLQVLVTNFQESPESPESLFLYTGTKSTADSRIRSPHPPYNMSHPECWQLGVKKSPLTMGCSETFFDIRRVIRACLATSLSKAQKGSSSTTKGTCLSV